MRILINSETNTVTLKGEKSHNHSFGVSEISGPSQGLRAYIQNLGANGLQPGMILHRIRGRDAPPGSKEWLLAVGGQFTNWKTIRNICDKLGTVEKKTRAVTVSNKYDEHAQVAELLDWF